MHTHTYMHARARTRTHTLEHTYYQAISILSCQLVALLPHSVVTLMLEGTGLLLTVNTSSFHQYTSMGKHAFKHMCTHV